jgi:ABC-type antimicrobial peptide transport system permease subunit
MLRNYFKIAFRNARKNKGYSFLNIAGLALGMAVALLAAIWIWDEISFNSYHKNHEQIAQVMVTQSMKGESYTGESIAMPLGEALSTQYSEAFKNVSLVSWNRDHSLRTDQMKLPVKARWVQDAFPDMFTLSMMQGTRDVLKDPSSMLISSSLAKALFGNEQALNQVVKLDDKIQMKVAGVYEDFPFNSTFYTTQILLPWSNAENKLNKQTDWDNHCGTLFVQLNEGGDFSDITGKIKNVPTPHIKEWHEEALLHPFDHLNLYSEFKNGKAVGGRIQFVKLFALVGLFVLLLACINFMNLSTAQSEKRAKEVGIRKSMGSLRSHLVGQFLSESLVFAFLAFVLSLALVQLSLPFFNKLADKQMEVMWSNPVFWLSAVGFTLITGLVAGSYPAFYLSHFKPTRVLKGVFRAGRLAALPRKVLVVIQFTVSVALITGTIVVFQQVQHAKSRPAGYGREGLITSPLTPGLYGKYTYLRNDLLQTGVVEDMAESSQPTSHFSNNNSIEWEGKDPGNVIFFRNVNVTSDFGNTVGWTIKEGRDFSRDFISDSGSVIFNEAALAATGLKNPVGKRIKFEGRDYTIVGIAKDMLTQSPYEPMHPSIFLCDGWMAVVNIRLKASVPTQEALAKIAPVFKKYNPADPFEYKFIDEEYARKYANEVRIGSLSAFFAILAILISCLGLFGLASFVAEQKTKEIGVRKVLGATVINLWKMQSKEFVGLVIIAGFIAMPVSWYFLQQWLENYNYRINISISIFILAIGGSLVLTLLTVSFQAIKAALANPVKSLRSE